MVNKEECKEKKFNPFRIEDLTEEECVNSLKRFKEIKQICWEAYLKKEELVTHLCKCVCYFAGAIDDFEKLAIQHFDNPPLKLEEMEEEEWYWDNKKKRYFQVIEADLENKEVIAFDYMGLGYEENRYYRKQVTDE